ncbi:hypothetical protein ACI2KR_07405 [Pseudomonas luteola]
MLITLDIESSGLGDESYPIQFGVTYLDKAQGKLVTIKEDIKPAEGWDYWDSEAEEFIHFISRERLEGGKSCRDACLILNKHLGDNEVIVDSVADDEFWLNKLFEEAGIQRTFYITNIEKYLLREFGVKSDIYEQKRERYEFSHDAGEDALIIYLIIQDVKKESPVT